MDFSCTFWLKWVRRIKLLNAISVSSASKNKTHCIDEMLLPFSLSLSHFLQLRGIGSFVKIHTLFLLNEKLYLLNSLFLAKMLTSMSVYFTHGIIR